MFGSSSWAPSRRLPAIRDRDLLITATFLGIVAGFAEAVYVVVSYTVFHRAAGEWVTGEIFWMAPLAACVTLLLGATGFIVLRRLARLDRTANSVAVFVVSSVCVFSFGRAVRAGIHPLALVLLSAGCAVQIMRGMARRQHAIVRWTRRATAAGAVSLGLWAVSYSYWTSRRAPSLKSSRAAPTDSDRLNVLLLVWDTARARSLSLYGYSRATTPTLDSLARHAAVMDAAITTAPWTLPAHASLLTGRYQHEHLADRTKPLDGTFPTLAEVLRARGYRTGGFVANTYWLARGSGIERGFEWYDDRRELSLSAISDSWWLSERLRAAADRIVGHHDVSARASAESINRSLLKWLDGGDGRPFFAFLNLLDAHEPYRPPGDFGFKFATGTPRYSRDSDKPMKYSDADLRDLRDAYDSCIYYLDHELGVLLEELARRSLLGNTIIVLTADHGETLGEHAPDLVGHENNVYYDVLNVPLVIFDPRRIPHGTRHRAPVSLADVPATIMDLVSPTRSETPFPGETLVPMITGSDGGGPDTPRMVLSQANPARWHFRATTWPISKGPLFSLVRGDMHYVVNALRHEQLFNLAADPWEQRDLSRTPPADSTLARFRAELVRLGPLLPGAVATRRR